METGAFCNTMFSDTASKVVAMVVRCFVGVLRCWLNKNESAFAFVVCYFAVGYVCYPLPKNELCF